MGGKLDWKDRLRNCDNKRKEGKTHKNMLGYKDQNKTVDKSDNATERDKSNESGKRRETLKIPRPGQAMQQNGYSKITKDNSTDKLAENARGQTKNQIQNKQNKFGVK